MGTCGSILLRAVWSLFCVLCFYPCRGAEAFDEAGDTRASCGLLVFRKKIRYNKDNNNPGVDLRYRAQQVIPPSGNLS